MRIKRKRIAFAVYGVLLSCAVFMCLYSHELQLCAVDVLSVCASSVIPSLFPFMVISSMLTQLAPYLFGEKSKSLPLFGIPACAVIPAMLGALCGFPVGVVTVAGMKSRGLLTREQAEKVAAISNNTGPAFVIEVIGASFWGSRRIGVFLYLMQIASAFLLGAVMLVFSRKDTDVSGFSSVKHTAIRPAAVFSEAVGSSALNVIRVCGFVVFFSVLVESVALIFPGMPDTARACISALLEFTSGCRLSSMIGTREALAVSAFSVGFGGVSVLCQGASFSSQSGFSLRRTVIFKIFQGIFCALFTYLLI